jgi:hypothetical protein
MRFSQEAKKLIIDKARAKAPGLNPRRPRRGVCLFMNGGGGRVIRYRIRTYGKFHIDMLLARHGFKTVFQLSISANNNKIHIFVKKYKHF